MSAHGRPEALIPQRAARRVSRHAHGRQRPESAVLRQATDSPQGLSVSGLSSEALIPQRGG